MRFLLDENLPRRIAQNLRQQGHDVFSVRESARGIADDEVWRRAAKEQRILITCDVRAANQTRRPAPVAVVLLRGPERATVAMFDQMLSSFLASPDAAKLKDQIAVVRPGRYRLARLR